MCLGVPGKVIDIEGDAHLPTGTVDFGGVRREVCLAYVPDVSVGDHVVVHVGFAIAIVDENEAARTWALLEEMALLEDELGSPSGEAGPGEPTAPVERP
jgi:hydrogenase expression/formation protein HypC